MKLLSLFFVLVILQSVPFKPKDEFDVSIDLKLKQRPMQTTSTVHLGDDANGLKKNSSSMLPYLMLKVKLLKLSENEVRFRVANNFDRRFIQKKIGKTQVITLDAGFTDDIKGKVTASEYVVTLLTDEKADINRIVITIEEDGTFLVNGEKRGKF
jgi:hypothetical protein